MQGTGDSALGSRPLLPIHRIAAGVETGDYGQCSVCLHDKHQRVGKAAKQGAADALVDNVELPGIGAHTLDHDVNGHAETSA